MKIDLSKAEMLMISTLINDFVHKRENSLSKRIKPAGVKKLKQVELRMGEMLIPEVCLSKKNKTELYKKTIRDFFPEGNQE
jgi:hypothetical protein